MCILIIHRAELAIIRNNTVDEVGINLYYPHRVKAPSPRME